VVTPPSSAPDTAPSPEVDGHPTGPGAPAGLFDATAAQPASAAPHVETPPPTGLFEAVGPQPPWLTGIESHPGAPPPPSLFEAPPSAAGHTKPSATGLIPPTAPHPAGAHDVASPGAGQFPAAGPPPAPPQAAAGAPFGDHVSPTGVFPAVTAPADATVRPADATGPMPVIRVANGAAGAAPPAAVPPAAATPGRAPSNAAPSGAAPAGAPPSTAGDKPGPPPGAYPPPRTDAWTFGSPDLAGPPPADAWSFAPENRPSGGPQSWPLPTPATQAHSTGATAPPGSALARTLARKQAKRPAWPLTLVGVVVAVAAGIALVFSLARTDPATLAATAATEAGSWPGVHYRGAIAALDGGVIQLDLTVTADGASGTMSRDGGRATAELLSDHSGMLLRANREWWLYHHATRADDLADSWVADPLTETREIDPVLQLHPAALAEHVRGQPTARWEALEQQLVDGRSGIVLSDGARRVVVGSDDPHPLLAVDAAPDASTAPVQFSRPADEEATAVAGAAARVRQEAAPRTLTQLLLERPKVEIQLQPEPLCTTETCSVTVTLTNSGTAPARGRLEISADGKIVADHPLDVQPGQVATFTATAPNPQFAQPGATGKILWESRAVDN
jgi:hypothetical protein